MLSGKEWEPLIQKPSYLKSDRYILCYFLGDYSDKRRKTIEKFAKENKYKRIVGPVDASFWLKYRMKINMFYKPPYTGEPYNKDYYYKLYNYFCFYHIAYFNRNF